MTPWGKLALLPLYTKLCVLKGRQREMKGQPRKCFRGFFVYRSLEGEFAEVIILRLLFKS